MSTEHPSSHETPPRAEKTEEIPEWARTLFSAIDDLTRLVKGGDKPKETAASKDEKPDDTVNSASPDSKEEQKPATVAISLENLVGKGKLGTATMNMFPWDRRGYPVMR